MSRDTSGFYGGRHYTAYIETVKRHKREGALDEAIDLLLHLLDATENEARQHAGWGVAPWYYEQLAIIYAKRGQSTAEMDVLERFARQPHAPGVGPGRLLARLEKRRASQGHP